MSKTFSKNHNDKTLTTVGLLWGLGIAAFCWFLLLAIASLTSAYPWHRILTFWAIALPILCVPGGVLASQSRPDRLNYAIAHIGFSILATVVTTSTVTAIFALKLFFSLAISLPILIVWAFIENSLVSGLINTWVTGLSNR